jgi:hypothetical protein
MYKEYATSSAIGRFAMFRHIGITVQVDFAIMAVRDVTPAFIYIHPSRHPRPLAAVQQLLVHGSQRDSLGVSNELRNRRRRHDDTGNCITDRI